ncbi:MAG: hypothetical protein RML99_08485 [Anaerolineae bacterium]|nr:hypothetical protein [Anaerolineae bacterium]
MLNGLSAFWFECTRDIVLNHCKPWPVEIVLWTLCARGERELYGVPGERESPPVSDALISATRRRRIQAYKRITGRTFVSGVYPMNERLLRLTAEGAISRS